MLKITIPGWEEYNDKTQTFSYGEATTISLEHSLISISKWESKYHKNFLSNPNVTVEEMQYYVKCMTLTTNVKDEVYSHLTNENYMEINDYIKDPMTATTFSEKPGKKKKKEIITSEIIYYWMISLGIPFECQKWHINRLMALIRVIGIKNQTNKKMSRKDHMNQTRSLNEARRASRGSRG